MKHDENLGDFHSAKEFFNLLQFEFHENIITSGLFYY